MLEKVDANPCGESRESFSKAPTLLRSEGRTLEEGHTGKRIPGGAAAAAAVVAVAWLTMREKRGGQLCNVGWVM